MKSGRKTLFRSILVFCALAAILVPLHLLTFGQPKPDSRAPWLLSDAPLYHRQSINGQLWAMPNTPAAAVD
ncbi:MAG TPA: hypothetical protein VNK24_01850 [Elusimicrobiota bacterium]|nr:hypothetical protein [Elusimicrobiota bacterium]